MEIPMIIGIAGATASGKTSVARYFEQKFGAFRTKASDVLLSIARERGLGTDKPSLQQLSIQLRKQHGEDFLAREIVKRVTAHPNDTIIVEGNRLMVDVRALTEMASKRDEALCLIFIDAPVEVRFGRYNKRETEPISFEAFCALEQNECERELPLLREYFAQHGTVIEAGDLTREQMHKAAEDALARVESSHVRV